ncbi:MAG: single-stranded DNA-binding protein [Bacteroidota bacterium]
MKNVNNVQLIGRLGKDPVIKKLKENKTLAKFTLATTEVFTTKNGEKKFLTQWHHVTAWGRTAFLVERFLQKGKLIALEGRVVNRSWSDKKGKTHYITEIVANDLVMVN